LTDETAR